MASENPRLTSVSSDFRSMIMSNRQDGGGARMRLKPPDHTLVPRCCLLRQPPTTFVGAFFFPARGGQGV